MKILADPDAALALLTDGDLAVEGRLLDASNASLYATVTAGQHRAACIYKPVTGERPLWDFPDGTLAARERAAYLLSDATGWSLIPPTVLRDGPYGPGMCQLWVEPEPDRELVDICAPAEVPSGWLPVLEAVDGNGAPVVLAHADDPALRRMAVLDVVINNADRKGGHVLAVAGERVLGVDHGLTFHAEAKLRTVLWGWAGAALDDEARSVLTALDTALAGPLATALGELITAREIAATAARVASLLHTGRYPAPPQSWPAIPWPPF